MSRRAVEEPDGPGCWSFFVFVKDVMRHQKESKRRGPSVDLLALSTIKGRAHVYYFVLYQVFRSTKLYHISKKKKKEKRKRDGFRVFDGFHIVFVELGRQRGRR